MTVKELKKLLEQFDDDLIIEVKNDYGDFDMAVEVYEDEESYCVSGDYVEYLRTRKEIDWKTKKVLKIF